MNGLVTMCLVVAIAAAVRSTWSPCGLSMLSTITPIGERGRGHGYGVTAAWFVAGALVGGATLGALAAGSAAVVGATGLSGAGRWAVAAGAALVAAAADAGIGGFHLPIHRRQVNELWLDRFRPWVYGLGFGWQIGVGLATYVMTTAVYLLVVLAAMTASPVAGLVAGLTFGLTRGLAVLLGRSITSPDRLREFHRRFNAGGPVVRQAVIGVLAAVAVVAAAEVSAVAGATAALLVAGASITRIHRWRRPVGAPASSPASATAVSRGAVTVPAPPVGP